MLFFLSEMLNLNVQRLLLINPALINYESHGEQGVALDFSTKTIISFSGCHKC